jgi:hypothetical protein
MLHSGLSLHTHVLPLVRFARLRRAARILRTYYVTIRSWKSQFILCDLLEMLNFNEYRTDVATRNPDGYFFSIHDICLFV